MNLAPLSSYVSQLELVITIARNAARRRRLSDADSQDFTQTVCVRFIEDDHDRLRRFEGRSALRAYLVVVIDRMLLDWLNKNLGKWRPSVEARRLGATAVDLERLLNRDGYSTDAAIAIVSQGRPDQPEASLRETARRLDRRARRRTVSTDVLDFERAATFADPLVAAEDALDAAHIRQALRVALNQLSREDRRLIVRRFHETQTIHALAEQLRVEPKTLYNQLARALKTLRSSLAAAGVTGPNSVAHSVTKASQELSPAC